MHELSLMEGVRDLALLHAGNNDAVAITGITLRVGQLAGVEPEALALAFEVVMAGTIAAAAQLRIEPVAPLWGCAFCDADLLPQAGWGDKLCPSCGGSAIHLRAGAELELASLDLTVA